MIVTPVTSQSVDPGNASPHLEYDFHVFSDKPLKVIAYLSPGINFTASEGLKFGISIDDGPVEIINMHTDNSLEYWKTSVADNIVRFTSTQKIASPGLHTLKYWMVDPGIVLQKLVIDTGGLKESYLGPPESTYIKN